MGNGNPVQSIHRLVHRMLGDDRITAEGPGYEGDECCYCSSTCGSGRWKLLMPTKEEVADPEVRLAERDQIDPRAGETQGRQEEAPRER